MLVYNHQKEFIGIDEADLKILGYKDLAALLLEVPDIADLFVKTPGYIHNFKHVHWIDFIIYSEPSEIQKVIIHANGKNFRATMSVTYTYLKENPSSKAYLIHLQNLRLLKEDEIETLQDALLDRVKVTPHHESEPVHVAEVHQKIQPEKETQPEPVAKPVVEREADSSTNVNKDVKIDINLDEKPSKPIQAAPQEHTQTQAVQKFDNGYIYDPAIASKELGLPLDLIEEFIQDFITQADDFKPRLYSALEERDIDNLKSLSHKLKGVAANLRIEDAFETLSVINTTSDPETIKVNLDLFYKIMAKLAGEEVFETIPQEAVETQQSSIDIDDDLTLDFKEEETDVHDRVQTQEDELTLDLKDETQELIPEITDDTPEITINETPAILETDETLQTDEQEDELALGFKDEIEEATPETIDRTPEITDELPAVNITQEEVQTNKPEIDIEIVYSKTKVANEIGLEHETFNELFDDYIQESLSTLTHIKESLINATSEDIKPEVLKLKGMNDNMRVQDFNEELKHLLNTQDKDKRLQIIERTEAIINKLSEQGV